MKCWVEGTKNGKLFYITSNTWSQETIWARFDDMSPEEYKEIIQPTARKLFFNTREEAEAGLKRLEPYLVMGMLMGGIC